MQFFPPEAIGEAAAIQPYRITPPVSAPWVGPNDSWLWYLYRLSNREKHREPAPVGLHVKFTITANPGVPPGVIDKTVPFEDGYMLQLLPEELVEDSNGKLNIEASFDVLFSEAAGATGIGVDALDHLYDFVQDGVLPRFSRFFE